jgi:four helix bundle protein
MSPDDFSRRLWAFAGQVCGIVNRLPDNRVGQHVAAQLVRCGTAAAPNYEEACVAESRRDFAHKLGIAAKEMRETRGWLRFIAQLGLEPLPFLDSSIDEADQLLRMLARSVHTARKPPRNPTAITPQCTMPSEKSPMPN